MSGLSALRLSGRLSITRSTPSSCSISSGLVTRLPQRVFTVAVASPSRLVGEGIAGVRAELTRVRGCPRRDTPIRRAARATFSHKGRRGLPWRHADGAVEADGFAVEHRVLDDVHREVAVFRGVAEACRM